MVGVRDVIDKPDRTRTALTWGLIAVSAVMLLVTAGGGLADDVPGLLLAGGGSVAIAYGTILKLDRLPHFGPVVVGYGCWLAAGLLLFRDWTLGIAAGIAPPTQLLLFLFYLRRMGRRKAGAGMGET
jgi:hypothetical protein